MRGTVGHSRLHWRFIIPAVWLILVHATLANAWLDEAAALLAKGDAALSANKMHQAIQFYAEGIGALPERWSGKAGSEESESDDAQLPSEGELEVIMSLHTNHGTALSYANESAESVLTAYKSACLCYRYWRKQMEAQSSDADGAYEIPKGIQSVATQAFFFLGMTHQDVASTETEKGKQQEQLQRAAKSYAAATKIDPNHWSSFANMGVVLGDVGIDHSSGNAAVSLDMYEEAILSYQKAIDILTGDGESDQSPTDPPENVREVVSELQYRIGLCLVPFLFSQDGATDEDKAKQCTLSIGAMAKPTTRSCLELAAFQFQTALQFHPQHEGALHALTIVTADATFGMSTDTKKVHQLFEEYAPTFEHSLVDELGYDGFHRMRRGFDRAMASEGMSSKKFPLVVDAGCGTGLAGDQFRNISDTLIGVDLSPKILDLARERRPNVYDELKTGDIIEILHQYGEQKEQVSLLVAADTFIYFNDLNDLFDLTQAGLEEGGYAVFSLENVSVDNEKRLRMLKPDWRWQLTPSGRVAHRKEYVEETAKFHSLETVLYEKLDNFREEQGVGVRGHLFVMKKQTGKDEL
ncbi:hypothetical protein ACHAXT_000761 [Thalassiosira profunda]